MASPPSADVIVIGAGWAGLSAAVRLTDAGCKVIVLESAPQVGGRARAVVTRDGTVDNGQHILSGAYAATLAMLSRVGVDVSGCLRRMPLSIDVPGQFSLRLPILPAPLHLAAGLLFSRGPAWPEKIRAARFIRNLQRANFRLAHDCSVSHWLDDNAQQGVLRQHLWDALCVAALNTRPQEASAQVFANVLRDTLGSPVRAATDLLLPTVDLSSLFPKRAVDYLVRRGSEVRCRARACGFVAEGANWQVRVGDEHLFARHLVLACAPQHTGALLASIASLPVVQSLRARLQAFAYEPIATAYLYYAGKLRLPQPMMALNDGIAQWVFDRGQLGGSPGLMAHVLSARGKWQEMDDRTLVAALHHAQRFVMGGDMPPPERWKIIREKKATFRCVPGLDRPTAASGVANLWLAGDYVAGDYPGTLEAAVRSGIDVAERIAGR